MVVFLTLTLHAGSFDFAAIRSAAATLSESARSLLFFFALIGLGSRRGGAVACLVAAGAPSRAQSCLCPHVGVMLKSPSTASCALALIY